MSNCAENEEKEKKKDDMPCVDNIQHISFISIFPPKNKKFYYKDEFAPVNNSIIILLYFREIYSEMLSPFLNIKIKRSTILYFLLKI